MVELIVVVVLIAVLSGIIVPRLWGKGHSRELKASARRLLVTGQYARNYALTRRGQCSLIIDPSQRSFGLAVRKRGKEDADEFKTMTTTSGRKETLPDGINFGQIHIAPGLQRYQQEQKENVITFRSSGQSDAAVVQITDRTQTFSMLVSPGSGKCRLVEGAVTQLPNDRLDLD